MKFSLFSATGCMRCKIIKSYMEEKSLAFQEFDFKAEGKDEFNAFYRKNRSDIFRGEEGVEFPILFTGEKVVQGVGMIIAFLKTEHLLDQFVSRSELSHGWVSGLNISDGDAGLGSEFIEVVEYLKSHGLKTQMETDGRNAQVLNQLIEKNLVDRLTVNLKGPANLYERLIGTCLDEEELKLSLTLAEKSPEYQIFLTLLPFVRTGSHFDLISPEEAAQAAEFVEQATGKKNHPFYIKNCIPSDENASFDEPNLFKYRTACRRYMVKTEIFKE